MLNTPPSLTNTLGRTGKWLLVAILVAALALLFARKITQLALPGWACRQVRPDHAGDGCG